MVLLPYNPQPYKGLPGQAARVVAPAGSAAGAPPRETAGTGTAPPTALRELLCGLLSRGSAVLADCTAARWSAWRCCSCTLSLGGRSKGKVEGEACLFNQRLLLFPLALRLMRLLELLPYILNIHRC